MTEDNTTFSTKELFADLVKKVFGTYNFPETKWNHSTDIPAIGRTYFQDRKDKECPFTKESVEKLRLLYESALEDKMSISGKTVSKRLNEVVKQRFLNNYAFLVFYDDDTPELRRSKILFWSIMLEKVLDKVVDKQEITFGDYMFLYSDYDNIRKKIKELSENTSTYMLLGLEEEERLEKLKGEQTKDEARKVFLGKEYNNEEKQAAYGEANAYISKVLSDLSSPKKGTCLFFLNCSITNVGTFIEQFPQYSQLQISRINVYKTSSKYDLVEDGERVVIPYEKWKEKSEAGDICALFENEALSWGYNISGAIDGMNQGISYICIGSPEDYKKLLDYIPDISLFLVIPEELDRLILETECRGYNVEVARKRFEDLKDHINFILENDGYIIRWQKAEDAKLTSYYAGLIDSVITANPLTKQLNVTFLEEYKKLLQELI